MRFANYLLLESLVEKDNWVTIDGQHILIRNGVPVAGNPKVYGGKGKPKSKPSVKPESKPLNHQELANKQLSDRKLTKTQIYVISEYTNDSSIFNDRLRAGKLPGEIQTDEGSAIDLDKAIAGREIPEGTQLFRGAELSNQEVSGLKEGSVITDKGFVSTTMDPDLAKAFAGGNRDISWTPAETRGGQKVLFNITTGKGSKGLALGEGNVKSGMPMEQGQTQQEVVLPRNSSFTVKSISVNEKGMKVLNLSY